MVDASATDEPAAQLLDLRRETLADGVVVHVAGEVDLVTAPQLVRELVESQPSAPGRLVLDLTHVTFLASVGLSTLVDHDRRCREAGVELRIVAGNRTVSRSITMTGLDETLTVFATYDEAVGTTS